MKHLFFIVAILGVIVIGFLLVKSYTEDQTVAMNDDLPQQPAGTEKALPEYFEEQLIARGVEDVGQPIEGFDADLLIMAFPGLLSSDFNGVETFEGQYETENGEITFVRDQTDMMSSAERTISREGYETLFENVATRLDWEVAGVADVDAMIDAIDTGERVAVHLQETAGALGVTIMPLEVEEDSRCPSDVTCIQAGTVRVLALLTSGMGSSTAAFTIDTPITTEAEEIRLVQVLPVPLVGEPIASEDYVFYFEIRKR